MLPSLVFWVHTAMSCAPPAAPMTTQATGMSAERVISRSDFGSTVRVRLGDVLIVPPPIDAAEWQVDYAADILNLLTSSDRRRSPGAEGWRFRGIGVGETDLALTEIPRRSDGTAPAPRRFVVTIDVTR